MSAWAITGRSDRAGMTKKSLATVVRDGFSSRALRRRCPGGRYCAATMSPDHAWWMCEAPSGICCQARMSKRASVADTSFLISASAASMIAGSPVFVSVTLAVHAERQRLSRVVEDADIALVGRIPEQLPAVVAGEGAVVDDVPPVRDAGRRRRRVYLPTS